MDRAELIEKMEAGAVPEFLFFWGHRVPEDGSVGPGCLSQWYPAAFAVGGIPYNCAEQYMMAEKARLFGDREVEGEILASASPRDMKALGRKVRNFDAARWDSHRYRAVVEGNIQKFAQNKPLLDFLLATGSKVLVEASPRDCIWGIGLGKENPSAADPARWRGRNLLGFALMDARESLGKPAGDPASRIVSELSGLVMRADMEDFVLKLRFSQWDDEKFAELMAKLKELAPVFEQLPDAVKLLLELYIMLPYQMQAFIEHLPEDERQSYYDRYFDLIDAMGDPVGVSDPDAAIENAHLAGRL